MVRHAQNVMTFTLLNKNWMNSSIASSAHMIYALNAARDRKSNNILSIPEISINSDKLFR